MTCKNQFLGSQAYTKFWIYLPVQTLASSDGGMLSSTRQKHCLPCTYSKQEPSWPNGFSQSCKIVATQFTYGLWEKLLNPAVRFYQPFPPKGGEDLHQHGQTRSIPAWAKHQSTVSQQWLRGALSHTFKLGSGCADSVTWQKSQHLLFKN